MRKEIPRETLEHGIRTLTTGSSLFVKKLAENLLNIEATLDNKVTNKTHIILHHSLTNDSRTVSWNPIREYHKRVFNTYDIGYHFGIEEIRDRDVYEVLFGRRINETGIHCPQGSMNSVGIGFMFCGNFDITKPPELMLDKASSFIADICTLTGIPPEKIYGHRDYNKNKSCPGKLFDIDGFKNMVIKKL